MSNPIDLKNPGRTIHAGVILMNSITEILDLAPIDLLSGITKKFTSEFPPEIMPDEMKAHALDVEFHWVNESGKLAKLTGGITIQPTDSFATCPPLDITLIGANALGYNPTKGELEFIRKSYDHCAAFLTICGGITPAQMAGVLEGKTCTAPRLMLDMLRGQSPQTNWVEKRYVQDGKIWTSGALLNGMDMMRAFITHTWGNDGTGAIAQFLIQLGHVPNRDVDYKDAESSLEGIHSEAVTTFLSLQLM